MPNLTTIFGATLIVSGAATLAWLPVGGWLEQRRLHREEADRPDPETLRDDIEAADPTPEARALKRLIRPPDGRTPWPDLDKDHLDLEYRLRRAIVPEQRRAES